MIIALTGSVLLGWTLGANDAANVFGTAVSSRMLRWLTAAILASAFVILGAVLQGYAGVETVSGLTDTDTQGLAIAVLAAAFTVALMTFLKLPVSTSQAVIGSIIGMSLMQGELNTDGLDKVVICWIGTPVGAMLICALLHHVLRYVVKRFRPSLLLTDTCLRWGLILAGCYGAYALGANNVANVAGVLVQTAAFTPRSAVLFGGISIAIGILTASRPVMQTIGRGIIRLDTFSAFIVVASAAITVHTYALVGVPVSASQATVGAVLGLGLVRGLQVVRWRTLRNVILGWIGTPVLAVALGMLFHIVTHIEYRP